ncbi:hypothetical protein GCM10028785_28670 [Hydrogenophaga soli]
MVGKRVRRVCGVLGGQVVAVDIQVEAQVGQEVGSADPGEQPQCDPKAQERAEMEEVFHAASVVSRRC